MSSSLMSNPQAIRSSTQSAPFSAGDRAQPGKPITGLSPNLPWKRRLPGSTGIPKRVTLPPAIRARTALGDHAAAIDAFRAYAEANPDMAAYVQPRIADAHLALGDTNAVITALEAATTGAAEPNT